MVICKAQAKEDAGLDQVRGSRGGRQGVDSRLKFELTGLLTLLEYKRKEGVKKDSKVFHLGIWKDIDGINWNGEGCGWGTLWAGELEPGLHVLILRCLLDTRWRCQVYFFTSLDLIFFLLFSL